MTIITRFAPSPTGLLHVGNVRTALINYLLTKKLGGTFILRMDDTDKERSTPEFAEAIKRDLAWLGLHWDDFKRQSDRIARYDEIKQQLLASGRLYPCFESKEELDMRRKMQMRQGKPPIYERAALSLSKEQISAKIAAGEKPHYRFLMQPTPILWNDMVRGETRFDGAHISDPIVIREDGTMTYILCSTVDDIDFHITHVVRGEDHVTNTAIQIQMFEALGHTPPMLGHLALIKSKDAEISKRDGGFDIASLRDQGIDPMAIASYFAKIGSSASIEPCLTLESLIASFDIATYGRAPATYDPTDLFQLNHRILSERNYHEVQPALQHLSITHADEPLWLAIRSNITQLTEVAKWAKVCYHAITPVVEDAAFLEQALSCLPQGDITISTWENWTKALSEASGKKGKALFMPLRLALTAETAGPELKGLLPLIGKEKILARLKGQTA